MPLISISKLGRALITIMTELLKLVGVYVQAKSECTELSDRVDIEYPCKSIEHLVADYLASHPGVIVFYFDLKIQMTSKKCCFLFRYRSPQITKQTYSVWRKSKCRGAWPNEKYVSRLYNEQRLK